jgi:arsenic resistance protein ArsH
MMTPILAHHGKLAICRFATFLNPTTLRMVTIPNRSSVAKAFAEFDDNGRMTPSNYYDRIVDVMEELVRFTVLLRPHTHQLVDRYSERKERH